MAITPEICPLFHDGRARRYVLLVPPGPHESPLPLVLVLHGGGGTPLLMIHATGFDRLAEQRRFAVALPEATRRDPEKPVRFLQNPSFWNEGSGRGRAAREAVDDVGFVAAVIDDISGRLAIDPHRIFATGFSNGASMTFRLGVELADRLAAIAPVAGHLYRKDRAPARPVPLLYVSGTADPLNPLDGGEFATPWGTREFKAPAREVMDLWAEWNGCDPTPSIVRDGAVRIERYAPRQHPVSRDRFAALRREVIYVTIPGAGHVWPGGRSVLAERITGPATSLLDASTLIWSFFANELDAHPAGRPEL